MDSENFIDKKLFKKNTDKECEMITNNNSSTACLRKSLTLNEMYEVGVIGMIDLDDGMVNGNKSPSPPKSPPEDCLLSSPDKFDSSGSLTYRSKKRQKLEKSYLTNSSPMAEEINDEEDLFDWLSDEIILYILSLVPKSMLATISLVCKRFRDLCLDESFWPRYDLSFKTLPPYTLTYVMTRGVVALRLNSSAISSPVFDPEQPFKDDYTFKVEYLDLSSVHITVKDLEALLSRCKRLKKLSIESCEVNKNICRAIAQNSKLDTLNMAMCTGLNTEGLHVIVTSCEFLENVNLSWCNLPAEAIEDFCRNISPMTLSLNLAGSLKSLSNKDVENLICRCPELTELDISDCIKITGEAISCIAQNAHKLQSLSISRSYKITGSSVLRLKGEPSLCNLNLFGNSSGDMYSSDYMKFLKHALPGVAINSEMMSSIARPTVGIRRTSVWGIRLSYIIRLIFL